MLRLHQLHLATRQRGLDRKIEAYNLPHWTRIYTKSNISFLTFALHPETVLRMVSSALANSAVKQQLQSARTLGKLDPASLI